MPTPRRRGPSSPLPCAVAASLLVLLANTAAASPAPTTTPSTSPTSAPTPRPTTTSASATATTTSPTSSTSPTATSSPSPAPASNPTPAPASNPTRDPATTANTAPTSAPAATAPAAPASAPESPRPADSPASASPATSTAPADTTGALAGTPATRPPRVDGPYIGGTIAAGGTFARVNNFPTPDPLSGATASLRVGQAIYPWMTIGLEITGSFAKRFADPSQRILQGAVLVDFGFLPVPRIPLSLHVGFGAGGGAVRQADRTARSGFGGAVFTGAVRYEIFPLAARKRPRRGGGFSLGPELGWLGFTPAAAGRPMSNTVYIGLFMGFYFGS